MEYVPPARADCAALRPPPTAIEFAPAACGKRPEMLRTASRLRGLMMDANYTASPVGQPLITEGRFSCCLGLAC